MMRDFIGSLEMLLLRLSPGHLLICSGCAGPEATGDVRVVSGRHFNHLITHPDNAITRAKMGQWSEFMLILLSLFKIGF